jgi:hypothetical protein
MLQRTAAALPLAATLALGAGLACAQVTVQKPGVVPHGATYAWAPVSAEMLSGADPRVANAAFRQKVEHAVDQALAAKGFKKAPGVAQAQLLVAYHVGLKPKSATKPNRMALPQAACASPGCNSSWGAYGPPQVEMRTFDYTQGTLVLDLMDGKSGQLAWRATTQKPVVNKEPSQARLNQIANEMTAKLP